MEYPSAPCRAWRLVFCVSGNGKRKRSIARGFTAIELMVVVAILAILLALAAPSFTPLMHRWRVRQATEGMQSSLYIARSEAIKRGGKVVMQRLTNNTANNCTGTVFGTADWSCGWIVCASANGNTCAATDPVLQRFDAPANLGIQRTANGAAISFNRWGMVGNWFGFNVFPDYLHGGISDPATLGLCMSSAGRVRIVPQEDVPCNS